MNQQQKALQMQQQFLLQMQDQYKSFQQYAEALKHEALLAKAVMLTLKETEEENSGLTEDQKFAVARASVAATTVSFIKRGLTPEQIWGAMVGV